MNNSRKPLLFGLLSLAVVLGFGFDVLNTRRAHEAQVARSSDRDETRQPLNSRAITRRSPTRQSPEFPDAEVRRFDPNDAATLIIEIGGTHPQPRSKPRAKPKSTIDRYSPKNQTPVGTGTPIPAAPSRPLAEEPLIDRRRSRPPPEKPAVDRYLVQPGETLSSIAAKILGDAQKWRSIAELNRIEQPHLVRSGMRLRIPKAKRANPGPTTSTRFCRVRAKDTLTGIAKRELGNSERWTEIADLNGISDPRRIQTGQKLRLP